MPYQNRILLFFLLLFSFTAFSQQTGIRFKITNAKNEAVESATVRIISTDSTKEEKVSDSTGVVNFTLKQGGMYQVYVSAIGYQDYQKNIIIKKDNADYSFVLSSNSKSLDAVVVKSRSKPLMKQEDDKTIVDPEPLATMSTNAFETIEKTPGLFIDQDGNIYISSTTPAKVYINGREQKMSAADIATMLKSLPPGAIASIEIMRTPSAKYDASSSGGIVNVVLKKGVKIGLTGSAYMGMNQGEYGNQFAGLNLSNNNGKLTTYVNLNYNRRVSFEHILSNRLFEADSILRQDASTKYLSQNFYLGYGLNYQMKRSWEISYDGRASYSTSDNNSTNTSEIIEQFTGNSSHYRQTDIRTKGENLYLNQGVNLKHKIDSIGSEWTTDLSWSFSPGNVNQYFASGEGEIDNKFHNFSAQTNLVKKYPGQFTFETGLKTTATIFKNSTDYFTVNSGTNTRNHLSSAAYDYDENINSAYVQGSKTISKVVIKAGTRLENTNMNGHQQNPNDTSFSIHRTDLFPYVYISRTVMKIAGYDLRAYLVYRRTILRPAYENLNPSVRVIDPYLYETGNPGLQPQFNNNYEANISVDERPLVAIGMNDTKDIFSQVIYAADSNSRITYRTYDNVGSNKEVYARGMAAIPPGKKFFAVVVAQYNHNFYRGLYESKPLEFKKGSWTFYTYEYYKLTKLTQLSLSGFLRLKGQQQFYELGTFGELRFSVNQQLMHKKLNLTLYINDIFKTNKNEFAIDQGSIHASGVREGDTRRFGINLRYNFGIRKKEDNNNPLSVDPEKNN